MLDGDARGLEAFGGIRGELFFEGWSPSRDARATHYSFTHVQRQAAEAAGTRTGRALLL